MGIDKYLVEEKIKEIEIYVRELEILTAFSEKEILDDFTKLRALEREFQLIIDEMIHLNLHFISRLSLNPPSDFESSFEIIATKTKIFPYDFAIKIAPAVGLRNKLVHKYEKVSKRFFIEQVKNEYKDFSQYVSYVKYYIDKLK